MKRRNSVSKRPSIICSSLLVPSVTVDKLCVSPRVNKADPCVLGSNPGLQSIERISVVFLPSKRLLSSMIIRRISCFSIFEIYPLTFLVRASISACTSSGSASCNALRTVSRNDFANSMRCSLIESLRICSLMSGAAMAFTAKSRASSSSTTSNSLFVLPASSRNCNCNALSCLIVACANSNAAMKSSSEISFELPSTIMMASSVPATIISISDSNN